MSITKPRRSDPESAIMKARGKSVPLKIDKETQKEIKESKDRLAEMLEDEEVRDLDKISISVILNDLDPYDQNILIAYFWLTGGSATALGNLFGVGYHVITKRIKKITKNIYDRTAMLANSLGVPNRL